ncbi:MAG: hypothetical protein KBT63_01925 [Porticoccaceae bacterium]|nr:hypothetical protein [Porticoccaceae bacterium]
MSSKLVVKQLLLMCFVIVGLAALVWVFGEGSAPTATMVGGGIGLLAYTLSSAVLLVAGGGQSAGGVVTRVIAGELIKVSVIVLGLAVVFVGAIPVFEPLKEGGNAFVLIATCATVIVVHAVGGVIFAPQTKSL